MILFVVIGVAISSWFFDVAGLMLCSSNANRLLFTFEGRGLFL